MLRPFHLVQLPRSATQFTSVFRFSTSREITVENIKSSPVLAAKRSDETRYFFRFYRLHNKKNIFKYRRRNINLSYRRINIEEDLNRCCSHNWTTTDPIIKIRSSPFVPNKKFLALPCASPF